MLHALVATKKVDHRVSLESEETSSFTKNGDVFIEQQFLVLLHHEIKQKQCLRPEIVALDAVGEEVMLSPIRT